MGQSVVNTEVSERALYLTRIADLKHYESGFSRIYYGHEFCQRLIPTVKELGEVLKFTSNRKLSFTLLTPPVTNEGLTTVKSLLKKLSKDKPDSEVIFNDWGILQIINEGYANLWPVMGRLLTKMKRGPRLMNLLDMLPEGTVDYFMSSSIDTVHYRIFLTQNRVRRVELDNLLQGISVNFSDTGISASLYKPYAYISVTRFCLAASCEAHGKEDMVGIFPCKKECQKYTFHLTNPVMPLPLIRKGNTVFFKNEEVPGDMKEKSIDRIVIEPEVPL